MTDDLFEAPKKALKPKSAPPAKKAKNNKKTEDRAIAEALYGSSDHPLKIGALEIPCYVLEDDRRVIVLGGMIEALGMTSGASGNRLASFVATKGLTGLVSEEVLQAVSNPILFRAPNGGSLAYGFEATLLADICEIVLTARGEGRLQRQQMHIAARCELLMRGFARVGIIALVDEATGYQKHRREQALEEILEAFIAKELVRYAKMFPEDFYREMFRLRGWDYKMLDAKPPKRPSVVGKYTTDIVYARLAPYVLEELKRKAERDNKGRLKHKLFQWLTEEVGHPKLKEHLAAVIALMKASTKWDGFYRSLNRALPKYHETIDMFPDFFKDSDEQVEESR